MPLNEDFNTFILFDDSGTQVSKAQYLITLTGQQARLRTSYVYKNKGVGGLVDGIDYSAHLNTSVFMQSQYMIPLMASDGIGDLLALIGASTPTISAYITRTGANTWLLVVRYKDASVDDLTVSATFVLPLSTNLRLDVTRSGQTITASLFNHDTSALIKSVAVTTSGMTAQQNLYAESSLDDNNNTNSITGTIGPLIDNNGVAVAVVPPALFQGAAL